MSETRQPYLRIVCGHPTAEEVAALVAVLTARARAAASVPPPIRRSAWSDPSRRLRRPLPHHPGAWRTSALPGH